MSSSSRLPTSASVNRLMPVRLPPGWAKLSMSLPSTGSALTLNTVGPPTPARIKAPSARPPAATTTSGAERMISGASFSTVVPAPSPHQVSSIRLLPSR